MQAVKKHFAVAATMMMRIPAPPKTISAVEVTEVVREPRVVLETSGPMAKKDGSHPETALLILERVPARHSDWMVIFPVVVALEVTDRPWMV